MRKATPLPVALAILSLARPALATDKPECGLEAFKEYNAANVALLMKDSPFMKADTLIAQRRLEETYCLKGQVRGRDGRASDRDFGVRLGVLSVPQRGGDGEI
jgi:chorismate-pyruvate lyase